MTFRVRSIDCYRVNMQTRFPFRYGIACMTEVPHLILRLDAEVNGSPCQGVAADGLPPKWFTKNPGTSFEADDLPEMLRSIRNAADVASSVPRQDSLFDWWWETCQAQREWAREHRVPPLLAALGSSLLERAAIDAFCRAENRPFELAIRDGSMGVQLGRIRRELSPIRVADVLPPRAGQTVQVRHTVGLGDPLTTGDLSETERLDDGLPHTLCECIDQYGLRYFKVKLSGLAREDCDRLIALQRLLEEKVGESMRLTLDGNEQYESLLAFRQVWEQWCSHAAVRRMLEDHLLFVEQPLHRDVAMTQSVKEELGDWHDAPPIIIDESDGELDSFTCALALGYRGTSHKNCKGIFKSLATAATIRLLDPAGRSLILSGEDLGNVGPVALLQDLAVVASLGIRHVERNGHHYFAGLSMFPRQIQESVLHRHSDLYHRHAEGFATLTIRHGALDVRSVVGAPFGLAPLPELSLLERWEF